MKEKILNFIEIFCITLGVFSLGLSIILAIYKLLYLIHPCLVYLLLISLVSISVASFVWELRRYK